MGKQYVKCLQDYMYMTKGKVYEVLEFNKYDPDFIIVEDDTGEPIEWILAKGEFELCDPPKQSRRKCRPLTDEEKKYIDERPEQSSRSLAKQLFGQAKRKSTINDYRKMKQQVEDSINDPRPSIPNDEVKTRMQGVLSAKADEVVNTKPRSQKTVDKKEQSIYSIVTSEYVPPNVTHLMIPDTQVKPDIDMSYLSWIGQYIADKKPEVLVHIGDHADMPSLSSYDKGKKSIEGKRAYKDIEASIEGMNLLLKPIYDLQQEELARYGEVKYKPKMVLTLGNHEERIMRHVNANPELFGLFGYDNLKYKEFGWEVYDYLEPAIINGVTYCHYMANPMTGKPYGGAALNILKHVGESFCMGHKQTLDVATRFLPSSGRQQWAIVAGAAYPHDEGYKGYQGNHHWRGIVVKHQVKNGTFNPMFVDLDYLKARFEGKES